VLLGVGNLLAFLSTLPAEVMRSYMAEQERNHERPTQIRGAATPAIGLERSA
jgi:hypothetical protein